MTTAAANVPPFALDGTVSADKLRELIAVGAELTQLDYKATCDLSDARSRVELVKDIGAMMISSGYLVIGVDDSGVPIGIAADVAKLFDQARLTDKIDRYLPAGYDVRSGVHVLPMSGAEPLTLAIVWIAGHPNGWCIFAEDGTYKDNRNHDKLAFRKGDVYARHGSKSEPWTSTDITVARNRMIVVEKERWRAEIAVDLERVQSASSSLAANTASAPSDAFTWQLDTGTFEAATVELIRHDDDIPIRRMMRRAVAAAKRGESTLYKNIESNTDEEFSTILDRLATIAALGLELERLAFYDLATETLFDLFDWATSLRAVSADGAIRPSIDQIYLRIAERLYALGSLAVRLRRWTVIRNLALREIVLPFASREIDLWHRETVTTAARAGALEEMGDGGQRKPLSLLLFARAVTVADPALRSDLPGDIPMDPADADPLLTSLCQFDFLIGAVVAAKLNARGQLLQHAYYPNFARFYSARVDTVAELIVKSPEVRAQIFPGNSPAQVANALRDLGAYANRESFWFSGWDGYSSDAVVQFVAKNASNN